MKLLLLDPKLLNRRGHYFHTDLAIHEECQARGISIEVLANRMVEPEIQAWIPARPFFSVPADPDDRATGDFVIGNDAVERDLKREFPGRAGPEDVVLVPTARDNYVGGIHRWYTTLPEPRPRVCLRLLFEPGFGVQNGGKTSAASLAEKQMRAWTSSFGARLSLVAECRDLAAQYEKLCAFPVSVLPLPARYPQAASGEVPATGGPHVIFLGEGRPEKGFGLLPAAFRTVLANHPEIRLSVQTSRRFDVDPRDLQSWRARSPHVSLVRGPLSVEQYDRFLSSSDIVLLPYDPQSYARRASLIFLEAAGTGKVVLTTRGTWMHKQQQSIGLGDVCVDQFSSAALAAALDRLLRSRPVAVQRAQAAAPLIRRHHNPAHFVDELLRIIEGGAQSCVKGSAHDPS